MDWITLGMIVAVTLIVLSLVTALCFRTVVSTNAVHIVQASGTTVSYGRGLPAGNVYYHWPAWLPIIGVRTTILPVSVFDKSLVNYAAYDIDRVPFVIDVWAFFRISDSNMAAERVRSFEELGEQLEPILQGAARTILATSTITEIMGDRAVFGNKFTTEVKNDLVSWGVEPVKSIELMDIRDAEGSKVIANIMAKKKSFIEMESRVAVAKNNQDAQVAEVEAAQTVGIRQQEAQEQVGIRTAQKDQQIGIAQQAAAEQVGVRQAVKQQAINVAEQQAIQATQEAAREAAQKLIDVQTVQQVGAANIAKSVQVVQAEQAKAVAVTVAEGEKQKTITIAEGTLQSSLLAAKAVEATGNAKGAAEKAILLAPVSAQITLAEKIAALPEYQAYLVSIRQIEAAQAVGVVQAGALQHADVKIIVTAGSPGEGARSAMDLFGAQGGQRLGAALEAFKNTPAGAAVLNTLNGTGEAHA